MLDAKIAAQLEEVFTRLEGTVQLIYRPSSHPKQEELVAMLAAVSQTAPGISTREEGPESPVPRFAVAHDGAPTGISFVGVPGGHEFSSLVLAILNADHKGKLPDPALVARIRRLQGPIRLRTFVSLSCDNCPDVVQALNQIAILHGQLEHEMVDGELAADEVAGLGLQGVPSVVVDGELLSAGRAHPGRPAGQARGPLRRRPRRRGGPGDR